MEFTLDSLELIFSYSPVFNLRVVSSLFKDVYDKCILKKHTPYVEYNTYKVLLEYNVRVKGIYVYIGWYNKRINSDYNYDKIKYIAVEPQNSEIKEERALVRLKKKWINAEFNWVDGCGGRFYQYTLNVRTGGHKVPEMHNFRMKDLLTKKLLTLKDSSLIMNRMQEISLNYTDTELYIDGVESYNNDTGDKERVFYDTYNTVNIKVKRRRYFRFHRRDNNKELTWSSFGYKFVDAVKHKSSIKYTYVPIDDIERCIYDNRYILRYKIEDL